MEYSNSFTLRQWISEHPKPCINEVTNMFERMINGLCAFHRMEMLHRDLKPESILIIDFSSVNITGLEEISTPVERLELLVTKNYTAPEYLLGAGSGHRSGFFHSV